MGAVSGTPPSKSDTTRMSRAVDVPLTKNSTAHRRALQPAFERCATPLTMGTAIFLTLSTRVRGGVPLGAPTRLSCAAAGFSSGLAGAVKATIAKSKLCEIEAETVPPSVMLRAAAGLFGAVHEPPRLRAGGWKRFRPLPFSEHASSKKRLVTLLPPHLTRSSQWSACP